MTVANARGEVVSSTNPLLVRTRLPFGGPAGSEGRGWSGEIGIDGSRELVAQVPVLSAQPQSLGGTSAPS